MEDPGALTVAEIAQVRDMLDRDAIRQVANAYFHAMDSRNLSLLGQVFTQDATYAVDMIGHPTMRFSGFADIAAAIGNVTMFCTTHHGVRNMSIDLAEDEASANLFAMDALHDDRRSADDPAVGGRLIQHGLRYVDKLERRAEGWRIKDRHLYCLWQIVTPNPVAIETLPPW